jgi:hypothetical protein
MGFPTALSKFQSLRAELAIKKEFWANHARNLCQYNDSQDSNNKSVQIGHSTIRHEFIEEPKPSTIKTSDTTD